MTRQKRSKVFRDFVVYEGGEDGEVFVTTPECEKEFLKIYFAPNGDRDLDEYDRRLVYASAIEITLARGLRVEW